MNEYDVRKERQIMSCMVMSLESLAALANAVEARLNYDNNYWGFEAPATLYDVLADCKTSDTYRAEDIYRKLYALNIKACNVRYAGLEEPTTEKAPTIDGGEYVVHRGPERGEQGYVVCPWHYHLANLLDFWLYQTTEAATRDDPLRLAMADFSRSLYTFIVTHSPEYIALRWGNFPWPGSGRGSGRKWNP